MRVFITGTAGFIGFHLARLLLQEGHSVHGFDGLTNYYDVSLKRRRHALLREHPAFTRPIARKPRKHDSNYARHPMRWLWHPPVAIKPSRFPQAVPESHR